MRKGLAVVLVIVASLSLGGCEDAQLESESKNFDLVKSDALKQASSWDGYKLLYSAKTHIRKQCKGYCSEEYDKVLRSGDSALKKLYHKSLDEADPRAYYQLFISNDPFITSNEWPEREVMRQEYAGKLIAFAGAPGSNRAAPELQAVAGAVIVDGRYVMLDYYRAVGYLHRGWSEGVEWAAGKAAMAAEENKNLVDAYLWALRCVGECSFNRAHLKNLMDGLDSLTIISTQKAAADRSVVTISDERVIK